MGSGEEASRECSATSLSSGSVVTEILDTTNRKRSSMNHDEVFSGRSRRRSGYRRRAGQLSKTAVLVSVLASVPTAASQSCIRLAGSTTCPAFNLSSISTDSTLVGFFPFLRSVTDVSTFDTQLAAYVRTGFVQQRYQTLFGCNNVNLANTTELYSRFTTTVLCNAIVQNSVTPCGLSAANSRPVCADTCAQMAQSEGRVISDSALCTSGNTAAQQETQLRADFTNCALPVNSLSSASCIEGIENESQNCGFGSSVIGLCMYCGAGGLNSTDTCCYNSQANTRCVGVVLPTITQSIVLPSSTESNTPTSSAPASSSTPTGATAGGHSGLSGGAIAGIVIGSVVAAILLAGLILLLIICLRRRRGTQPESVFNQPSPPRKPTPMAFNPTSGNTAPAGYEVLPGGRIARMSALEGHSDGSPPRSGATISGGAPMAGAVTGYAMGRRRHNEASSSDFDESPESDVPGGVLRPPPTRRQGSLSSSSALGMDDPNSPHSNSGGEFSSPQGVASQQSEQLAFFKDYYSSEEIHPGDKVATLWAYQPRASDEFLLERGDVLKVVGIWDDGWATGVMLNERAEDWDSRKHAQRDSGVSNGSGRILPEPAPPTSTEIKAFPLVCVCVPEHWRKTIEGDGSTESASSGAPPPQTTTV